MRELRFFSKDGCVDQFFFAAARVSCHQNRSSAGVPSLAVACERLAEVCRTGASSGRISVLFQAPLEEAITNVGRKKEMRCESKAFLLLTDWLGLPAPFL